MSNYEVNIKRLLKEGSKGSNKTEIWAEITDKKTCKTMNRRIWWEEDNGTFHDESPMLPAEVRTAVDNAWIEKRRKW